MRSVLLLLVALVAVCYAVAHKQASVFPVRRVSPALAPVREAADVRPCHVNLRCSRRNRPRWRS